MYDPLAKRRVDAISLTQKILIVKKIIPVGLHLEDSKVTKKIFTNLNVSHTLPTRRLSLTFKAHMITYGHGSVYNFRFFWHHNSI